MLNPKQCLMNLRKMMVWLLFLSFATYIHADDGDWEFVVFNAANGLADNSAQTIKCTPSGRLITSTIGQINFYDGSTFTHIDPSQEHFYELPNYTGHYHPYFDRQRRYWLKDKKCVVCVDLNTERFVPDISAVFREMGADYQVEDLFIDEDGSPWLLHSNVISSPDYKQSFPVDRRYNLQDLAVFQKSILLLFYENSEVVGFDINTCQQMFRTAPYGEDDQKKYQRTTLLCPYREGYFQIRDGSKEGVLLQFDAKQHEWKVIREFPYKLNNIVINESVVYLASEYGYWTYDIASSAFNHVGELMLTNGQRLLTDINIIEFDRQNGMWVGTESRGLLYSKPFPSPFRAYEWSNPRATELYQILESHMSPVVTEFNGQSVNCVFKDSRGWTWVGTRKGLCLYKTPDAKPIVYKRENGLLNDVVHSIIEDTNNHIWVSTSYGITGFKVENNKVEQMLSFSEADNVPRESFVNGRAVRLGDGTIIMQALDHMVTFHPRNFHFHEYRDFKIAPKLVKLVVDGINVEAGTEIGGKMVTDKAVTRTSVINVNYNHSSINLTFSALNYFRPVQTFYRYRILELDKEWKMTSYYIDESLVDKNGLFTLRLGVLPPGEYHVEVQASMSQDTWNEGYTWLINVEEPWWRTSAVFLSLAFIALLLVIINMVVFARNLRLRLRRNNGEKYVIKQLRSFFDRCDKSPVEMATNDTDSTAFGASTEMSDDFVMLMLRIEPLLNNDKDKTVTVRSLAERGNVSVSQFYTLVMQNINNNPKKLVLHRRLEQAARLLRETDDTPEQIAEAACFKSPEYFSSCFFDEYGRTPEEYRQVFT